MDTNETRIMNLGVTVARRYDYQARGAFAKTLVEILTNESSDELRGRLLSLFLGTYGIETYDPTE